MLTPAALLQLAEDLAVREEEVAKRASIGRAYYAAAHRACAIGIAAGLFPGRPNLHQVWSLLDGDEWRAIGNHGRWLKLVRTQADYDLEFPGDLTAMANEAVALARELVARMEALPAPRTGGAP